MEETTEATSDDLCGWCVERAKEEPEYKVRQLIVIGETEKKKIRISACPACDGGLIDNYTKNN